MTEVDRVSLSDTSYEWNFEDMRYENGKLYYPAYELASGQQAVIKIDTSDMSEVSRCVLSNASTRGYSEMILAGGKLYINSNDSTKTSFITEIDLATMSASDVWSRKYGTYGSFAGGLAADNTYLYMGEVPYLDTTTIDNFSVLERLLLSSYTLDATVWNSGASPIFRISRLAFDGATLFPFSGSGALATPRSARVKASDMSELTDVTALAGTNYEWVTSTFSHDGYVYVTVANPETREELFRKISGTDLSESAFYTYDPVTETAGNFLTISVPLTIPRSFPWQGRFQLCHKVA